MACWGASHKVVAREVVHALLQARQRRAHGLLKAVHEVLQVLQPARGGGLVLNEKAVEGPRPL